MTLSELDACVKKLFELHEQKCSEVNALNEQITSLEQVIVDLDTRVTALENSNPGAVVITTDRLKEDDCHVFVKVTDGPAPAFSHNQDNAAVSISATGGSGLNGNGRIYTLTFAAHPDGANFSQSFTVNDDVQPDSGIFEILAKTPTSLVYQITQGDDGGSEDDNDYYAHEVRISGTEQTFISEVYVNGNPAGAN